MKKGGIIGLIILGLLIVGVGLYFISNNYIINASIKIGCRAPDELGCQRCAFKSENTCTIYSSQNFSEYPDIKPWYNMVSFSNNSSCPNNLPSCAQCSKRSETQLLQLISTFSFKMCNCNSVKIGIDPCSIAPNSCACLCHRYNILSKACPK